MKERAARWAIAAAAAAMWLLALRAVLAAAGATAFPYSLDREEGFLLEQALRLRAGETIYPALRDFPFTVGNYTPLYPALYALALFLPGELLGIGRGLALASALACAGLIGAIVWRLGRRPELAALAPAIFLATSDAGYWMQFARVDFLALALSLGGLLAGLHRRIAVAGLLFAAAFLAKQTQLAAPAALVGVLLLESDSRRDGLRIAGIAAGAAAAAGLLLLAMTGGEFWRHTVTYNANAMEWGQVPINARHAWLFLRFLIVAAPLAAWCLWRSEAEHPGGRTAAAYLMLCAAMFPLIAKVGSDRNYLLEFDAALAISVCGAAACARARMALAFAALLALHAGWSMVPGIRYILRPAHASAEMRAAGDAILLRAASTGGDILAEDPIYAIMAGKPVLFQPFIMARLAEEGRWDQQPFLDAIAARRFSLVIAYNNFGRDAYLPGATKEMRDAFNAHYRLVEAIPYDGRSQRYLYEPRPVP